MKWYGVCTIAASVVITTEVNAFEFRARFVERSGNTDTVISGNTLDGSTGTARRVRIQFGVFDDAAGPAPIGGFLGWNFGSISVTTSPDDPTVSDESRTPGRLTPFNFAPSGNGDPAADPFEAIFGIDATLGTQSPEWVCDPDGSIPPAPEALARAVNTWVSVYEITVNPRDFNSQGYQVTFAGNLIAATEWRTIGVPVPPDCGEPGNPSDDMPGTIIYAPIATVPVPFSAVLDVFGVPAPSAMAILLVGVSVVSRRRR